MTEPQESPQESDVVERARQALGGLTPGPWWWTNETRNRLIAGGQPGDMECAREVIRCAALLHPDAADAEFIAAAPALVRDLVAEVERLTAERDDEVERLEADLDAAAYRAGRKQGELAEALAAVERLRTDLARMTERAEGAEVAWQDTETERDALRADLTEARAAIELARRALDGGEQS